jgi:glutamate synthase (NADPH) large chain
VNAESVAVQRLSTRHWEGVLKDLISQHAHATHSLHSANILNQWEFVRGHFWQICPKELVNRLSHPLSDEASSNSNNRMLG